MAAGNQEPKKRGRIARPAPRRIIDRDFWNSPHWRKHGAVVARVYQGCLLEADDQGRLLDNPVDIWHRMGGHIQPVVPRAAVVKGLEILTAEHLLLRYQIDAHEHRALTSRARRLHVVCALQVMKFVGYQPLRRPTPSTIQPPTHNDLRSIPAAILRQIGAEIPEFWQLIGVPDLDLDLDLDPGSSEIGNGLDLTDSPIQPPPPGPGPNRSHANSPQEPGQEQHLVGPDDLDDLPPPESENPATFTPDAIAQEQGINAVRGLIRKLADSKSMPGGRR